MGGWKCDRRWIIIHALTMQSKGDIKMRLKSIVFAIVGLALTLSPVYAAAYKVDDAHSTIGFKVRHLFSNTQGNFNKFEGAIDYEPGKPETWKAEGKVDVASINTNNSKRDEHLRSADFFDAAGFPEITFTTTKVTDATDTTAKLEGTFKMHGVEKPVVLGVTIHGAGKDPWGSTRAGFTAVTKINRKDFGITYNQKLDNGGLLLGEEVEITLEIEAVLVP